MSKLSELFPISDEFEAQNQAALDAIAAAQAAIDAANAAIQDVQDAIDAIVAGSVPISAVTGLQAALDEKAAAADVYTKTQVDAADVAATRRAVARAIALGS